MATKRITVLTAKPGAEKELAKMAVEQLSKSLDLINGDDVGDAILGAVNGVKSLIGLLSIIHGLTPAAIALCSVRDLIQTTLDEVGKMDAKLMVLAELGADALDKATDYDPEQRARLDSLSEEVE